MPEDATVRRFKIISSQLGHARAFRLGFPVAGYASWSEVVTAEVGAAGRLPAGTSIRRLWEGCPGLG